MRWKMVLFLMIWLLAAEPAGAAAPGLRGGVIVNEILIDPNSSDYNVDTDGSGAAASTDEFVEFYNNSSAPLLLDGIELWRATGIWFTFPEGSLLPAGQLAVVVTGVQAGGGLPAVPGGLAFDAGRGTGVLANGGDNLVVYDPLGDSYLHLVYNEDPVDVPQLDYPGFSYTAHRLGEVTDFDYDLDGVSQVRHPVGSDNIWRHVDVDGQPASPGYTVDGPTAVRLAAAAVVPEAGPPWPWLAALLVLTSLSLAGRRRLLRRVGNMNLPRLRRPRRRRPAAP